MQLNWTDRKEIKEENIINIKKTSGVYRLIYFSPIKNDYYIYYVGQAEDLNKRISEHLLGQETNSCCVKYLKNYTCYFRVAEVEKKEDRDAIEVTLYAHFKPTCVDIKPDAKPIEINFI